MDALVMVGLAAAFLVAPAVASGFQKLRKPRPRRTTYIK